MVTKLEIFGDVVKSLGVFQALQKGIRSIFDQQGALWILRGQWTPNHLQILWENKTEGRVDT